MRIHNLKIEDKYYIDILQHDKTWEIRYNDRDYKVGDLIRFWDKEHNPCPYLFKITYILYEGERFGLKEGYCIMSIEEYPQ